MAKKFFTNREGNTLMKQFQGLLENNPNIKNLDSVVGFLRASGYFTLRPFLNSINKVRMLIGIDVDKYIVKANIFCNAELYREERWTIAMQDEHRICPCHMPWMNLVEMPEALL